MFKIEITEVRREVQIRGKQWERVSAAPDSPYAYTPEIPKEVEIEVEILKQTVDKLDLPAVIKAINGL